MARHIMVTFSARNADNLITAAIKTSARAIGLVSKGSFYAPDEQEAELFFVTPRPAMALIPTAEVVSVFRRRVASIAARFGLVIVVDEGR